MIIRHAEKHQHGSHGHGVDEYGRPSRHELTIRGWQRAGALIHLFSPPGKVPPDRPIQPPRTIFASDATRQSPSMRAMHTAGPLADALGIEVNHDFAEGEEADLAAAVIAASSPVLIVWHHGKIIKLVHKIAGKNTPCPDDWPDDRFDMIWILDRNDPNSDWTFSQIPQLLLPGDSSDIL